jgi:purine nucleoside phosphorylase
MGGHGPTYETAAEVRMARIAGRGRGVHEHRARGDARRPAGLRGREPLLRHQPRHRLSDTPLAHSEVTEVADKVAVSLRAIIEKFLDAEVRG